MVAKSQSYSYATKFGGVPILSLLNTAQAQTVLLYSTFRRTVILRY